jgi:hypothetical protein
LRRDVPTLLHEISPRVGITADDLAAVEDWAAEHLGVAGERKGDEA